MKLIKVIKINLLALLALPLLLLATAAQMAAKAMKKAIAIIGTILAVFAIALVFEIVRNFGQAMEFIVILIVCIILGGIFSAIIFFLLSLASTVIMAVAGVVIGLLEGIYSVTYSGYASLYHKCKTEYGEISEGGNRILYGLACILFTMVRIVNRALIFFVTHALKLLVVCSLALTAGGVYLIHAEVMGAFGIGLVDYLKLFPAFEIVYGVVLYAAMAFGLCSVLISLGREWNQWGMEMSMSTSHYDKYVQNVREQWQEVQVDYEEASGIDDKRRQKCVEAAGILQQHIESFDEFVQEITPIIDGSDDYMLRSEFGEYAGILQEISEKLSEYHGEVPLEVFEKYVRRIQEADELKKSIRKRSEKVQERQEESKGAGGFFAGCNSAGKLEKRYKALCKTYHPDNEAGDEETFKVIQAEYENMKRSLGA